jgi:hypothetical protein
MSLRQTAVGTGRDRVFAFHHSADGQVWSVSGAALRLVFLSDTQDAIMQIKASRQAFKVALILRHRGRRLDFVFPTNC